MEKDAYYMSLALIEAERAAAAGDTPIGAVMVRNDQVIAKACNERNLRGSTLAHAELLVIEEASRQAGDWRLEDCTLYVTLEPCPMCAGAILQARIPRLVFGARNPKAGCVGSVLNLLRDSRFNHQAEVEEGVLAEASARLLSDFFSSLRSCAAAQPRRGREEDQADGSDCPQ